MNVLEKISKVLDYKLNVEHAISRKELSTKLNISNAAITKWLQGGSIATEKIPELCNILEITPNQLFGYEPLDSNSFDAKLIASFYEHPEYHEAIKALLNLK